MSGQADISVNLDQLFNDILKTSKVAEVDVTPQQEEIVSSFVDAYGDIFKDGAVAFRTTTKPQEKRNLSVRYLAFDKPHDPYQIALEKGFFVENGHPVEGVLRELQSRFPSLGYGADFSVKNGFEKIWILFPSGPLSNKEVCTFSSLPKSVKEHADYFAKYDLNLSAMCSMDYQHSSFNLYFERRVEDWLNPDKVIGLIKDLGFEMPPQNILDINLEALVLYYTFTWESSQVERLCFGMAAANPDGVPAYLHPVIEKVVAEAPILFNERRFTYGTTCTRNQDYMKIEADYVGKISATLRELAQV